MPNRTPEIYPLRKALIAQLGGLAVVGLVIAALAALDALDGLARVESDGIALILALLQGGVAAMLALRQGAPPWWLGIHLGFVPLAFLVHRLDIAPGWFLAGFVLLLLVFWRTGESRVPLYFTNRATATALIGLLPPRPCRVIDLGCGDGGLLLRLAKARPDCHFTGMEHAPLTWLLARLRTWRLPNVHVRLADFWHESLATYDLVYAFLSPAPMSRLWQKAVAEMHGDAILVSNSFIVPNVEADREIVVADRRATRLHLYHPDKAPDSAAFPVIPATTDRQ